jgi:hypothetical protein
MQCGILDTLAEISRFLDRDPLLLLFEGFLDSCVYNNGLWNLCSICYTTFLQGLVPKFSAKNNVNVTLYQYYPKVLEDLTLI